MHWVPTNFLSHDRSVSDYTVASAYLTDKLIKRLGLTWSCEVWDAIHDELIDYAHMLGAKDTSAVHTDKPKVDKLIDIIDELESSGELVGTFDSNPVLYERIGSLFEKLIG